MHDTPMPGRQIEQFCSSETRHEVVVRESMHGELEQECSSESQQVEMSDMDAETLAVMQSFLEMLEIEHVVQDISAGAEVEQDCSSETQRGQLSEFVHTEVERVCSLQTQIDSRIDLTASIDVDAASVTQFDFDMLMIEADVVMSGHVDLVLMDAWEVTTIPESQLLCRHSSLCLTVTMRQLCRVCL